MIPNNKIGQNPAEFDNVIANIFKLVCDMDVHKGIFLLLVTYDPHNPNLLEYGHFWCPLVLFHATKLFLSKILSAHKMIFFSGLNRFLETVIKNLLIIHS